MVGMHCRADQGSAEEAQMAPGSELRQPLRVDVRFIARRLREWTLMASRRWGQGRGDDAPGSVATDEVTDHQAGMMIRPSTHERVALTRRCGDWP
jgi:hypothetical protein